MAHFQLLHPCEEEAERNAGTSPSLTVPKDPWFAVSDAGAKPNLNLNQLALSQDITQTPEYQAANLPPYNGQAAQGGSRLLDYFLL